MSEKLLAFMNKVVLFEEEVYKYNNNVIPHSIESIILLMSFDKSCKSLITDMNVDLNLNTFYHNIELRAYYMYVDRHEESSSLLKQIVSDFYKNK